MSPATQLFKLLAPLCSGALVVYLIARASDSDPTLGSLASYTVTEAAIEGYQPRASAPKRTFLGGAKSAPLEQDQRTNMWLLDRPDRDVPLDAADPNKLSGGIDPQGVRLHPDALELKRRARQR